MFPPDLVRELRASLQENLLAHWYPAVVDRQYGGYLSNLAYDWAPASDQDKMIVTQARHVWTTSKAADFFPERREEYLATASHGVAFLRDKMWDREQGGFVSLASRQGEWKQGSDWATQGKTAYGNAFAIYALAAGYVASGDTASLTLAQQAFRWLDDHMHDPRHGGYFQFVGPDDAALVESWENQPAKNMNSSLHLLEAFTELYAVWPDVTLRNRLEEMLLLVRDRLTTMKGYLQHSFKSDWTLVSHRDPSKAGRANRKLDHVSYGHDVEAAYLMLEATHALGWNPDITLAVAKRIIDHALAYGWDSEVGGLYDQAHYLDSDRPPTLANDRKVWWAQAEGLNAFLVMSLHLPEDRHRYYERFEQMWQYICRHLIDHEHGGWYPGGLDTRPDFRFGPKATIWAGTYHTARALMNVIRQLENHGH